MTSLTVGQKVMRKSGEKADIGTLTNIRGAYADVQWRNGGKNRQQTIKLDSLMKADQTEVLRRVKAQRQAIQDSSYALIAFFAPREAETFALAMQRLDFKTESYSAPGTERPYKVRVFGLPSFSTREQLLELALRGMGEEVCFLMGEQFDEERRAA